MDAVMVRPLIRVSLLLSLLSVGRVHLLPYSKPPGVSCSVSKVPVNLRVRHSIDFLPRQGSIDTDTYSHTA